MQASLDLEYGRSMVFFTWAGFDEMDEVSGSGSAELLDDGSLVYTNLPPDSRPTPSAPTRF